ncbi:DUF6900 domain-containing protein [Endozoicomonas atrinae]|uniref:DUF6900 domain-containing protein n=1 Tax=Endozoicomonas atrinae TaxID=1333660 RepID=UPI003AFFB530
MNRKINDKLTAIARDTLRIKHLETINSGEDFSELAVWLIKEALEKAYQQGFEDGQKQ